MRGSATREVMGSRRFWIILLLLCAIGAGAAIRRIVALETAPSPGASQFASQFASPFVSIDAHFAAKAGVTLLHLIPALLFALFIPLQFISSLRERHPRIHRWTGRIIVSLGVALGISALSLSAHPIGGLVESAAAIVFGCFFLLSLGKAWWHIRHGRVELHREWMTRMVGIALGVATTRPIMAVFFATSRLTGLEPHQFFGPAMWLGLVSTYLAAEALIHRQRRRDHEMRPSLRPAVVR
jgi:uncharacterized membrane protein